jgi:rhodanese-related sulfurtransferase
MTNTVDIATFAARHADGAHVIDVREPYEYLSGHVPGARPAPMSQIAHHIESIPKDEDVYVICASGNRSLSMATLLTRFGVRAHSVDGGTSAWVRAGHPIVAGHTAA